ncbi:MAG: phosphate acyltransferase PlsX [Anaerolineales bacterium]|nr:phosphate acyltransferase PlsX [Anaerolineales bacterium]
MRIVLDAMGSDSHPEPEIEAAIQAAKQWGDAIILAGPEDVLCPRLEELRIPDSAVRVVHAPEILEMTDKPANSARGKAESSMAVGMELVKSGEADAFVTAGNTGGAMANALFRLGRIRGVKRPALAPIFPVQGSKTIVLDIGANTDCKPEYLLQFALMGDVYSKRVLGKKAPRIALLSNGEERGKGNLLVKETTTLLEAADLHFVGNAEPKEVYAGFADVVVTDGFYGNIFLKTSESMARYIFNNLRAEITSGPVTSIGGLLLKPAFKKVAALLDPSAHGAALLLGVKGLVFIGHGSSNSQALVSAIRGARGAVEADLLVGLEEAIQSRLSQA